MEVVFWTALLIAALLLGLVLLFLLVGLLQLVCILGAITLTNRTIRRSEMALDKLKSELELIDQEREELGLRGESCSEELMGRRTTVALEIQQRAKRLGWSKSEIRELL